MLLKNIAVGRRFAETVIQFRWLIVIATFLICGAAATGILHISVSSESRDNFGPDNPQLIAFEQLEETFTRVDNIFFVIAPKTGDIFTRETLQVINDFTEEAWRTDHVNRVDSITNYQHTWADGDDLIVSSLVDFQNNGADGITDGDLARMRSIALNEPLILNRLVSTDGRVAGINIDLHFDGDDNALVRKAEWAWERQAALRAQHPNLDIYVTGAVMISASFSKVALRDIKTQTPLMYLFVIVMMVLLLRAVAGVVGIVITTILTMATSLGVAGWFSITLTAMSSVIPVVILTVVVAHGIHLMAIYYQQLRAGVPRKPAMIEAIEINLQPVFLTSLSTGVGFFSLNLLADVPPIQQIGNVVGMAVCFALIISLTFLPAFVYLLPSRVKPGNSMTSDLMGRFAEVVIARRKLLLVTSGLVALTLLALAPLNIISDQFSKYFSTDLPIRTDTDFTDQNLGGLYRIEYALDAGVSQGVSNPDYLRKIDDFAEWYRGQAQVTHVSTYTDIVKQLNQRLHNDDPTWYVLPDSQELAAQYLLLYELSLPLGLDMNNQLSFDKAASRMIVSLPSLPTPVFTRLQEQGKAWLREHAPEMEQEGSSMSLMFTHIGVRSMLGGVKGAAIALVLIALVLILSFRSIKMGLISVLPNLLPGATGFGVWYLLDGHVGLSLAMVLSITMGIVVDDTVHFLSKYLRARRDRSAEDAVRYAFRSVGVALWITTLVLITGFMLLATSDFKMNNDMGILVSVVIGIALIFDFILLPPILMQLDRDQRQAKTGCS